jgi:hypothetical protein
MGGCPTNRNKSLAVGWVSNKSSNKSGDNWGFLCHFLLSVVIFALYCFYCRVYSGAAAAGGEGVWSFCCHLLSSSAFVSVRVPS